MAAAEQLHGAPPEARHTSCLSPIFPTTKGFPSSPREKEAQAYLPKPMLCLRSGRRSAYRLESKVVFLPVNPAALPSLALCLKRKTQQTVHTSFPICHPTTGKTVGFRDAGIWHRWSKCWVEGVLFSNLSTWEPSY